MLESTITQLTGSVTTNSSQSLVSQIIGNALKGALFLEAMRNINWSRGYCWYAELDGVPTPFQRGGVMGLPAESVQFNLAPGGHSYEWSNGVADLKVPKAGGDLGVIQLSLIDDEQGTLHQFFERWYNQVYNPYLGVLPITEACKCLTIHRTKSTRRNIRRVYYNIDESIGSLGTDYITSGQLSRTTEGIDFLVYPVNDLLMSYQMSNSGQPFSFSVQLQVAQIMNQDFGNPTLSEGVVDFLGFTTGVVSDGTSFLDRIADYI